MNYVFKPTPYYKLYLRRIPAIAVWGVGLGTYLFGWHAFVKIHKKVNNIPYGNNEFLHPLKG